MALDLAAGRAREVFESDEADLARPLIAGQLIAAKPHQLVGIGAVDVPSVLDELEMIATLVTPRSAPAPAPSTVTTPSGARPTNGLGPI